MRQKDRLNHTDDGSYLLFLFQPLGLLEDQRVQFKTHPEQLKPSVY